MLSRLILAAQNQSFHPNLLSLFLNPFLFIRTALRRALVRQAPKLTGTMLDFGCGRKPYKQLFTNVSQYIGVDIEVSGHSHANSEIDVFYDGKTIPFPDNYFDSAFSSEVIEHIFNPDEILPEIRRVLKPNALALFTFPFAWSEHEQPYDYARYTSFGAKYLFEKNGFEVVFMQKTGNFLIAIWQLFILYIYLCFPKNKILSTLLTIFIISPLNFIGLIFSILPLSQNYYFNNILLVRKK